MVIEFLTFDVPPDQRSAWIEREGEVWSTFLEQQPGFVRKELWCSAEDERSMHAVIWWESMERWKAITPEQVRAVDADMGDLDIQPTSVQAFELERSR